MSLLRIPFILLSALSMYIIMDPPNAPPEAREKKPPTGLESLFVKAIPWLLMIGKAIYPIYTIFEVAVIVASATSSSPISSKIISTFVMVDHPASAASRIRVTPCFLISCLLAVSGCLIRLACYRTLGRLFTFELSIRKDHRLVTSGPYSVVRHPSYTGAFMMMFGYPLCHLSHGSWLRECSGLSFDRTANKVLMALWMANNAFIILVLMARMKKEDDMLRKEFSEWDEWARRVPYKIIPYVY